VTGACNPRRSRTSFARSSSILVSDHQLTLADRDPRRGIHQVTEQMSRTSCFRTHGNFRGWKSRPWKSRLALTRLASDRAAQTRRTRPVASLRRLDARRVRRCPRRPGPHRRHLVGLRPRLAGRRAQGLLIDPPLLASANAVSSDEIGEIEPEQDKSQGDDERSLPRAVPMSGEPEERIPPASLTHPRSGSQTRQQGREGIGERSRV
jgi:hypothetical protein